MSRDIKKSSSIVQVAFIASMLITIAEITVGILSMSVALLADGIDSVTTTLIFLIIWIGLRLSGRASDGTFHFGYYRVEALGSLIAAFVSAVFGGFIFFESYRTWLQPRVIVNAEAAIIVAMVSAALIALVSYWIEKASQEYGSTALRAGGLTGVVDVLSSIAVVVGVALNKYFGILHADAIAGALVALAIFVGAYLIFKESSLVLVDACKCGDVVNAIGDMAKSIKGVKEVHSIRMRRLGSYMTGDMHVVVASDMMVREADQLATRIEDKIKEEFDRVIELKIRIESDEAHDQHTHEFTVKRDDDQL